jgi:arylsulfatase A-like enzyme
MSHPATQKQIDRRDFIKMGATAAATAALTTLPVGKALALGKKPRRPNIVFVFSDEHRWCSLPFTAMPQVQTPSLVRLAKEGTRFDNCCSGSPICIPYRGMLITGQWPHQSECISNDFFENGDVIGIKSPTIAHSFRNAGYATGYIGKWHLRSETTQNAGFDFFEHWLYGDEHWDTQVRDGNVQGDFHSVKGYNATLMTDRAIEYIGKHARGEQPFFLILSINPPHWRWDDAPEEFLKLYPEDQLPFRPNVTEDRFKKDKDLLHYRHYHAHISAVDRELGRVMDALKKQGLDDDTILIYTSDHGSSFGSNGVGSKGNPFDEAVRVPFLVRWPGHIPRGRIAEHNLGTIDLFPTLCGLAGIAPPDQCHGQDFSPVFLGQPGPDPAAQLVLVNNFQRNYFITELEGKHSTHFCPFRAVRTKHHTFVVNAAGDWLLYDNQADPYQMKNLVDDPAEAGVKEELRKELMAWLARAEDPYIPEAWKKLTLPERIARQNRYYAVMGHKKQWDKSKEDAVAPYLTGADEKRIADLRIAADQVFDEAFFGRYLALSNEVNGKKRQSKRPIEEVQASLNAHEMQYAAMFKAEAEKPGN